MVNPNIPHLIGITLDTQGVANTKVIFTNFTSGGIQIIETDSEKRAVIDCANFVNGYSNSDVIGIENAGSSIGGETVTIDIDEGVQIKSVDAEAASTTSNIGM